MDKENMMELPEDTPESLRNLIEKFDSFVREFDIRYYKLVGQVPVLCNFQEFNEWYIQSQKDRSRIVKQEHVGKYWISTVFLPADHGDDTDHPLLWETEVFNGDDVEDCERCTGSWDQALAMHQEMVAKWKENVIKNENM